MFSTIFLFQNLKIMIPDHWIYDLAYLGRKRIQWPVTPPPPSSGQMVSCLHYFVTIRERKGVHFKFLFIMFIWKLGKHGKKIFTENSGSFNFGSKLTGPQHIRIRLSIAWTLILTLSSMVNLPKVWRNDGDLKSDLFTLQNSPNSMLTDNIMIKYRLPTRLFISQPCRRKNYKTEIYFNTSVLNTFRATRN